MLALICDGKVLLETRPAPGIWGGLLCLPQADDMGKARHVAESRGGLWNERRMLAAVAHGFTHFELDIHPVVLPADMRLAKAAAEPGATWLPIAESGQAALPAPVKRLLGSLATDAACFNPDAGPARRGSAG